MLSGHLWAAELVLEDRPNVRLRHPMELLTGLLLLPVYVRNWLLTHLCTLLVELLMVVGVCAI